MESVLIDAMVAAGEGRDQNPRLTFELSQTPVKL